MEDGKIRRLDGRRPEYSKVSIGSIGHRNFPSGQRSTCLRLVRRRSGSADLCINERNRSQKPGISVSEKIITKDWNQRKKQDTRKSSIYGIKEEFGAEDTKKTKRRCR